MKIDSIFYQIFLVALSIFFELAGQPSRTGDRYEFKSVEIKQTSFRIDGVFLPSDRASGHPVYFGEVQF